MSQDEKAAIYALLRFMLIKTFIAVCTYKAAQWARTL